MDLLENGFHRILLAGDYDAVTDWTVLDYCRHAH